VGATTVNDELKLEVPPPAYAGMKEKLLAAGIDVNKPWIVAHPGASETKREYPAEKFHDLIAKIVNELDVEVIFTGTLNEKVLTERLRSGLEEQVHSAAGLLSLEEFMALIDIAPLVLSVNTGTVHIASALKTPVIVLYALTNPQHTPWKTPSKVFTFPVDEELQSRNVILNYVSEYVMEKCEFPDHDEIVATVRTMMRTAHQRYA
jgi:ADP-heptose:LPS heptosyltransferase